MKKFVKFKFSIYERKYMKPCPEVVTRGDQRFVLRTVLPLITKIASRFT